MQDHLRRCGLECSASRSDPVSFGVVCTCVKIFVQTDEALHSLFLALYHNANVPYFVDTG